ncbi:hypothetical protein VTK73DRAFT_6961 [Phialemonium thermophilum]|uniref:RanBD1 domain-containing protein n=1 Tax=Phialemonium thermophilum TaxID=223376 RepID=A0ABR3XTW7_9PEZI
MTGDSRNENDLSDSVEIGTAKEDAETTAARRELKQTSISEKGGAVASDKCESGDESDRGANSDSRGKTPEAEKDATLDERLREQMSSPKKKRAHDQLDEQKDLGTGSEVHSRADRSEPEKKRPRDIPGHGSDKTTQDDVTVSGSARSSLEKPPSADEEGSDAKTGSNGEKADSSTSAFAKSGFAKLASSSASPFGTLGAGKPSIFSSSSSASPSPFATVGATNNTATTTAPPKLSFGGAPTTTTTASPFGTLNGKSGTLGAAGFGSILSGPRLTSFAKPGEPLKTDKPAKPFGAPESDAEEGSDDQDGDGGEDGSGGDDHSDNEDEKSKEKDESKLTADDKKKLKLQKVVVDDGEAGEVTLLQVRAKMFQMEKGTGWKERGTGMLKINVPESTVDFDDDGNPLPESFDASVLEAGDSDTEVKGAKNVRLIMRQDHTLRVILNSIVLPAMKFELSKKLKATLVLFTAFDNGEVKQVQMKMSDANATAFKNLIQAIQKQLRDI